MSSLPSRREHAARPPAATPGADLRARRVRSADDEYRDELARVLWRIGQIQPRPSWPDGSDSDAVGEADGARAPLPARIAVWLLTTLGVLMLGAALLQDA